MVVVRAQTRMVASAVCAVSVQAGNVVLRFRLKDIRIRHSPARDRERKFSSAVGTT